jgi:hypothetical protein
VRKHFPDCVIPVKTKERTRLHKKVDPILLTDPEFLALHEQFRTKIDQAKELIESAIRHKLRFASLVQSGINFTPVVMLRSERRLRATKHLSLPRATDFVHFKRDSSLRSE